MLENIKKQLESAYEIRDINDIEKDIDEGKNLLKNSSIEEKKQYINKIEIKYNFYLELIKVVMNMRVEKYGKSSVRKMTIEEEISQDIDILILIKDKKLYEELLKVINNNNEKFNGGVNFWVEILMNG